MDQRKERILQVVVDQHVETAEPVGSLSIARQHGLEVSPATIRNDLQALEEAGYLRQPHPSAGRVPSPKGYRYYVDRLMGHGCCTEEERRSLEEALLAVAGQRDLLVQEAVRLLAAVSGYAAVVSGVHVGGTILRGLQLIGDADGSAVYVGGLAQLFREPEFGDAELVRELVETVAEGDLLLRLLRERHGGFIAIGGEDGLEDMPHWSVVGDEFYCRDEPAGRIGVVGPTRMRYARAAAVVEELGLLLTRILSERA